MQQPLLHSSSSAIAVLTTLLLLPQTALSLQWPGPRATATPSLPDADGWTPKPTAAPPSQHVAAAMGNANPGLKLFRRQQRGGVSKYANTCGYVDGNGEYSFTCSGNYACAYNSEKFAFGCCSGTSSSSDGNIYFTDSCYVDTSTTGCYAFTERDQCTGLCTVSAEVCASSTAPVCRTVLQFGTGALDPTTYTQYDCIPLGGNTLISLQNSYTVSSSVEPNPLIDPSYTFDGTTFIPIGAAAATTSTSRSTSPVPKPPGQTSPVPTPTPEPEKKKSNTGAIAGGVVGGLAALALAAGVTIWALMKRKEKARREAGAVNEVSHVTYVHEGK